MYNGTHHRTRIIGVGAIKSLDVLKFKHVSLYKGFSNLLVGPRYEKLVVMISFLCQSSGEVDWGLQVHSLPVWSEGAIRASVQRVSEEVNVPHLFYQA